MRTDVSADQTVREIVSLVVERLAPERVVLFGSRARGDHDADSDYDVAVVSDSATDAARDRVRSELQGRGVSVDVVLYTRELYDRQRGDIGTLTYIVEQEGRVLYTADGHRERRYGAPVSALNRVGERPAARPESVDWWTERAMSDLGTMEREWAAGAPSPDTIVFHGHQALEKMLKALLIIAGSPPPRTDDLPALLARCPAHVRADQPLSIACALLNGLWPTARYPNHPMPTRDQAAAAVEAARIGCERVRELGGLTK